MRRIIILLAIAVFIVSCKSDNKKTTTEEASAPKIEKQDQKEQVENAQSGFDVTPVNHATMVLTWDGVTIYVDPVGNASAYADYAKPDLILITDIHGDHLSVATLEGLNTANAKIIAPQAVADELPSDFDAQVDVLNNGDIKERSGFTVEAIPMYNLREESLKYHEKGRGNGYVIEKGDKRVYISGDTEDIPEMLALKDIDIAFVCMNLPYTMTEIQAARAVAGFKPKIVYPYHYRGAAGFSNVEMFKAMVKKSSAGREVEVIMLDWYPTTN